MSPKMQKWRSWFAALAIISLFAWVGLIWATRPASTLPTPKIRSTAFAVQSIPPSATHTPTPSPIIKSTMLGKDGAVLVHVPEGEFVMGSNDSFDKQPVHKVNLDSFWIDQNEVTNQAFSYFVTDTGYQTDAEMAGWSYTWDGLNWVKTSGTNWRHPNGTDNDISGKEKHPVVQVSWNDAAAYCKWAGRRLPTEAEWEKAARGIDQRIYPWGNDPPNDRLLNAKNPAGGTMEVGSYAGGVSPYGAYDMSGNVWEWVNDWYDNDYYASLANGVSNPAGPISGNGRVVRGGAWLNYYDVARAADRSWSNPLFSFSSYGFRCATSLP